MPGTRSKVLYWYGYGGTSGFAAGTSAITRAINTNDVTYSIVANTKGYKDIYNVSNTAGQKVHFQCKFINNVSPYSGAVALQKAAAQLVDEGQFKSSQVYAYIGRFYDSDTSGYVGTYTTTETPFHISSGSTADTPTHITYTWNTAANISCYCKVNGIWLE